MCVVEFVVPPVQARLHSANELTNLLPYETVEPGGAEGPDTHL